MLVTIGPAANQCEKASSHSSAIPHSAVSSRTHKTIRQLFCNRPPLPSSDPGGPPGLGVDSEQPLKRNTLLAVSCGTRGCFAALCNAANGTSVRRNPSLSQADGTSSRILGPKCQIRGNGLGLQGDRVNAVCVEAFVDGLGERHEVRDLCVRDADVCRRQSFALVEAPDTQLMNGEDAVDLAETLMTNFTCLGGLSTAG